MTPLLKHERKVYGSWLGLLCLYVALMAWHSRTTGSVTVPVAGALSAIVLGSFFLGDILLKLMLNDKAAFDSLSFRLLSGVLVGTALLYVAALALPFGLPKDAAMIAGAVVVIWALARRGRWAAVFFRGHPSEATFLTLGLVAVTLWCRDLLRPIDSSQAVTVIRAWGDVYYHLSQITAFAVSKGASTVHDVQMAGVPVQPYHFASYVVPALLVSGGGISAWTAYASFLVPVGILLTFLAAHAIGAPIFGAWPAAVAALSLLLLPDASQQGFGNPFFSYHWLQQVAPAGAYGVACAAMTSLLMIEACRSERLGLIFASYFFLLLTLLFKAQIFVAVVFVILIFPAIFFPRLATWLRVASVFVLASVFIGVVNFSQRSPSVPVLRLDGSSLPTFSQLILENQRNGLVKGIFSEALPFAASHGLLGLVFGLMLLVVTFGIFPAVYGWQLKRLRQQFEPVVWSFPILIVGTFLVMAIGLALDDRRIGRPEELLHRPFVWAYFVIVVWAIASAYQLHFGDAPPAKGSAVKWTLPIVTMMMLILIPGYFGHRIQTMPSWGLGYQELPSCLVKTAAFIKANSVASDIVQDTQNDPKFTLSALSEREPYAIDSGGVRVPQGIAARLQAVATVRTAATLDQALAMSKQLGIQWWVVGPDADVAWASGASQQAAFTCGRYRAFRF